MKTSLLAALMLALAASADAQVRRAEQGAIRFIHGGIGEEEQFQLLARRADFNLRLTFALARSGSFLADVEVLIADANKREVLRVTSDGPWLYAQLAPGRYTVSAAYAGEVQSRAVQVRERGAVELLFYWEDSAARDRPARRGDSEALLHLPPFRHNAIRVAPKGFPGQSGRESPAPPVVLLSDERSSDSRAPGWQSRSADRTAVEVQSGQRAL